MSYFFFREEDAGFSLLFWSTLVTTYIRRRYHFTLWLYAKFEINFEVVLFICSIQLVSIKKFQRFKYLYD